MFNCHWSKNFEFRRNFWKFRETGIQVVIASSFFFECFTTLEPSIPIPSSYVTCSSLFTEIFTSCIKTSRFCVDGGFLLKISSACGFAALRISVVLAIDFTASLECQNFETFSHSFDILYFNVSTFLLKFWV